MNNGFISWLDAFQDSSSCVNHTHCHMMMLLFLEGQCFPGHAHP